MNTGVRLLTGLLVAVCLGLVAGCAGRPAERAPEHPSASVPLRTSVKVDEAKAREHAVAGHQAFAAQDFERAAAEYGAAIDAGYDALIVHFRYGYSMHVTGHPAQALPHHIKAVEIPNPALKIDAMYNAACACALLGRKDEALSWLSKAIDAGFKDLEQVLQDHDLDSLRGNAEFQRLVRSIPSGR